MAKKLITIKKIAVLGRRELRYTEIQGIKKFDVRAYDGDKYDDGVRFTQEEINQLYQRMKSGLSTTLIGNKTLIFDNDEYVLSIENNGRTYTRTLVTKSEMDKLMQILEVAKDNLLEYDDTPKVEEPKKKRGRPAKTEDKTIIPADIQAKLDALKVSPQKSKDVIEFPKPKKEIEKLVTEGHATYAECIGKIEGFKAIYKDADSQYVLDGLLELCKVDKDFRNNVMRDDKDFEGALDYMADMCKQGYAYKKGFNYAFVDRDTGLGFAIDYFNSKPKPKTELKPNIPTTNTAKVEVTTPKKGKKRKVV